MFSACIVSPAPYSHASQHSSLPHHTQHHYILSVIIFDIITISRIRIPVIIAIAVKLRYWRNLVGVGVLLCFCLSLVTSWLLDACDVHCLVGVM